MHTGNYPHITTDNDRLFIQEKANTFLEVYFSIFLMETIVLNILNVMFLDA